MYYQMPEEQVYIYADVHSYYIIITILLVLFVLISLASETLPETQ